MVLESPGCAGFVAAQGNSRSPGAERNDPWGGYAMATCSVPDLFSRPRGPRSVSEEAEGKSSRKREREREKRSDVSLVRRLVTPNLRFQELVRSWGPSGAAVAFRHVGNQRHLAILPTLFQKAARRRRISSNRRTAFVATRPLVQGAKLLPSPPI